MEFSIQTLIFGFILAFGVAFAAWLAGSLTPSGALGATLLGGLVFGLGGLPWAVLLLTFFVSSSVLSRLFKTRKSDLTETFEKGSKRDWAQVAANGGIGGFLVVLQLLYPDAVWPWLAYAGALAAVNADTWATELGTLSKKQPRMITSGKPVARGTSGGVTMGGTFASLSGAALIGLLAGVLYPAISLWRALVSISLAGLLGSLLDSLLGATVQVIYFDPIRQKETERVIVDAAGNPVKPLRGYDGINNDVVNFLAGLCGAFAAVGLYATLSSI